MTILRTMPAVPLPASAELSVCQAELAKHATITAIAPIEGPGECGGPELVRLDAILLAERTQVTVKPPAILRCSMAEEVVSWVREDVAHAVEGLGARLATLENYDSYDCRGRNNIAGAKVSEHGKANALDIRALKLTDGKVLMPTDALIASDVRESLRKSACLRFNTVLGPGSDGYHEDHVHIDLQDRGPRRLKLCQWDVREPEQSAGTVAKVPLPLARPAALPTAMALRRKL